MRIRRNPSVPMLHDTGELVVRLSTRTIALDPLSALIVNYADDWTDLPPLVELVSDVVDPEQTDPGTPTKVRTSLTGLVLEGILQAEES